MNQFISIEEALLELQAGRMIILVDDEHREQEGDLMIAAEKVTPEAINFMTKYARGVVCLAIEKNIVTRLRLPLLPEHNVHPNQAAFTVSVEAATQVSTGVSAHDRARTIQVVINPNSTMTDISMPGHVFPIQGRDGGVLERAGHTEGSIDLAKLAGLQPAAVICEIMNDDGTMARLPSLHEFAKQHHIKLASINDLINYRLRTEMTVKEIASAPLPLKIDPNFTIKIFRDKYSDAEHIALIHGAISTTKPCLVRIHSECLTGDVFGSLRCDCGEQLQKALKQVANEGGVVLYMRQEGRGIGLANKIKTYELQSQGLDTVDANIQLGFQADHRSYALSAQILRFLAISQVKLLTNNPHKVDELQQFGINVVERIALETVPTTENQSYLKAKRDKLGHLLTPWDKE